MLHEPSLPTRKDRASDKKASLGLKMFFIYLIIYAGFTYISITNPTLMGEPFLLGLNLAIIYGFGLIILAIVLGWIYHLMCSYYERKMNREDNI